VSCNAERQETYRQRRLVNVGHRLEQLCAAARKSQTVNDGSYKEGLAKMQQEQHKGSGFGMLAVVQVCDLQTASPQT
jgi:hypothetical protein